MKKTIYSAVTCLLLAGSSYGEEEAAAGKPEVFMIVKVFDFAKKPSLKLMNDAELKALNDEVTVETKNWDKAMAAAEKAWKADSSTAKKPFPKSAISQRKITMVQKGLTDPTKASSKITEMEKTLDEDAKAEEKRLSERKAAGASKIMASKKTDDKSVQERAALLESARSLFQTKLSEIASGAAVPAPAADATKKGKN